MEEVEGPGNSFWERIGTAVGFPSILGVPGMK